MPSPDKKSIWAASLAVFCGSALGGGLRLALEEGIALWFEAAAFPIAVFLVNIAGTALLGFFFGLFSQQSAARVSASVKVGLTAGFCGGLTTFSALSWQLHAFLYAGRLLEAVLYLFATLLLGYLAWGLARRFAGGPRGV